MIFSSIPFMFYFLPAVILLYFAVPKFLKNSVLLLSSLFFYGWGEPKFLIFMILSITQGYVFGLLIEKHRGSKRSKVFLAASAVFSLGLLGYCKYADFFIKNFSSLTGLSLPLLGIALPIGISFYTFQILSYAVDVYRGDTEAQKNPIDLGAYIAMFPQLIAGPIVRYSDIAAQLKERTHSFGKVSYGVRRFVIGLSKKILIADILGEAVSIFLQSDEKSFVFYWLYALSYLLQIYFDFSGYSDMAIGLGSIFGFKFMENFNYPYISKSVTEFWRRWHISLGTWFRDYLYIPMGGNRVSKLRWFFNIFVVWMATGFWHGADWSYIIWGLYFAFFLIIEKEWILPLLKKYKVAQVIYIPILLVIIITSFVIFHSSDSGIPIFESLRVLFTGQGVPFSNAESLYYLRNYLGVLIIGIVAATPLFTNFTRKLRTTKGGAVVLDILEPVVLLALLAVCTAYLVDGSFSAFLYYKF